MLAYAVVFAGGYGGIGLPSMRLLSLGFIVTGLSAWAVLAWRRPEWRPWSALWPSLIIPIAVLAVTTLTSPFPRLGLEYVAWAVLLVVLYLFLVRILTTSYAWTHIGWLLAGLGLVISIAYIALVVGHWFEWWDLLGRPAAPMLRPAYTRMLIGGPTIVAPVVVLLAAGGIAGTGASSTWRRVVVGLLALTTLVAVFLSGTRGAWLASAMALAVAGIAIYMAHRERVARVIRGRRFQVGAALVGVLAVVGAVFFIPALVDRLANAGDGGRSYYFATAQRMFEDSPLVGQGPGNWAARRIVFSEAGEPDIYVAHPHNLYLQTLAENGLLGLLAGVLALLIVGWLVASAIRDGDQARERWGIAALFVLVYLGVSFMVDSFANLPVVIALAAVPFAALDASSRRGVTDGWLTPSVSVRERSRTLATVLVFVSAVVATAVLFRTESSALDHQRAVAAIDEADWAGAVEPAQAAAAGDPEMIPYQVTLGLAAAAAGDWEAATAAFQAAADTDELPQTLINLALARLRSGAPHHMVVADIERGLRLGDDPSVSIAAADLYAEMGMEDAATDVVADLLAAHPSLAADPYWQGASRLSAAFPTALRLALARSPERWDLALMAGEPEHARVLADLAGDDLAGLVIDAWSGAPGALATLQAAAREDPNAQTATWAARVSAKEGDRKSATAYRRLIKFTSESLQRSGYELRVAIPGAERLAGSLSPEHTYGVYGYRRATPGGLLAPGLVSVVEVDLALAGDRQQPTSTGHDRTSASVPLPESTTFL